jgi:hypothetical protein
MVQPWVFERFFASMAVVLADGKASVGLRTIGLISDG